MRGYAIYNSNLGLIKIGYEEDVVVYLKKINEEPLDYGDKTSFTDMVFNEVNEYFNGLRKEFTFKYKLVGTEFQKRVWDALLTIPYGKTKTYKEIAILVGNQKASRAVGLANNKNPITIVVPCHRVIGVNKKLVGYAGGLEMKQYLLEMERNNI